MELALIITFIIAAAVMVKKEMAENK
ncbi:conserved hypothetical protein [Vibrio nigripulchritudo MADA3029]|uniref:Uncharacterized protein n=2 Tax=Vibrio nigripulchritudo TaxID=28173 RepID=U4KD06_9VIBR|nr:conserved hypothetical protein [Vibrio nigripulchritudo FTn2]CCN50113.1 conserved hypothetical protein [Vibrio nigripulchritudo MADA3020]CCN58990.1 conserved hypothetical protein [Vibrio nigripulchritudo MADA3029]CCN65258.1 conserved hypothetical protein [Vibrio nigripulchritudo POn4]CCN69598.1 conserved hypothetical protein [Vibrio nigripulchritudo SFn118]CCN77233.1 conserved hypothetical protein [Vibrio nigripulchritudo SO65]CCN91598.1 conserved hypothetical protein [Vibrio nigripulchrit